MAAPLMWAFTAVTSCSVDLIDRDSDSNRPIIELQQNELIHYDTASDGRVLWKLRARTIEFFDERQNNEIRAEEIEVRYFDADGNQILLLTGDRLVYKQDKGQLVLTGDIRGEEARGLRFSAEEIFWDEESHRLWSESPVQVEREDFSLTGAGLEYLPDEGTMTIHQGQLQIILKDE